MLDILFNDIQQIEGSGGSAGSVTEPISLDDAKTHLYITGTQDDALLTTLIKGARGAIERYCNICLVPKTIIATLKVNTRPVFNFSSRAISGPAYIETELPYGPVLSVTSITYKDFNNDVVTLTVDKDYFVDGTFFKFIRVYNAYNNLQLTYETGYDPVPDDLLLAIKNEIAFRFEQRGEGLNRYAAQQVGASEASQYLANPYRRLRWL